VLLAFKAVEVAVREAGGFGPTDLGVSLMRKALGAMRLLDGNHRINTWVAKGDADLRPVHIHTVEGAGQLVELPPVR
jgi:hypothetical protein